MATNKEAAQAYKKKQIESSKPVELVVMLYNAALDFLTRAEKVLDLTKPETIEIFHKHLLATQNIITELTVALNMEEGGELAQKLFQLYDYMNYRLVDINVTKKIEGIDEVKKLLSILKEGWEKLAEKEKGKEMSAAGKSSEKDSVKTFNMKG